MTRLSPAAKVLAAAVALAAVSLGVYCTGGPVVKGAVVTLLSMLVAGTVLARMIRAIGPTRVPYALLLTGFTLLIAVNLMWMITVPWGGADLPPDGPYRLLLGLSYLFLLAAAFIAMAPSVRRDPGGVLDAATMGVALASATWQAFLSPALHDADAPASQRVYAFTITIILSAAAGIVTGVGVNGSVPRAALPVLGYFATAILIAVAANVLDSVLVDATTGMSPDWIDSLWTVSYAAAWAAVAHPAGPEAFAVGKPRPSRLSSKRLALLGAALVATPAIAVTRELAGWYTEWLSGALAHLAILIMVLLRVGQLARAHRAAEARLQVLADHDVLTGLPNRRSVDRHLSQLVSKVDAGRSPGVVVAFIDLDGFKEINDTRGHATGDQLLQRVTRRLAAAARIDQGDVLGRLGGDEFILIAECDPAHALQSIEARLRGAFDEPVLLTDGLATISASIGSASATRGEPCTEDALLTLADHAMYEDKRRRRATRNA
ncbi:GGDEF domain-containing protein [Demequina zhanjiangensis]|uniref:GGDEF domain-containing protein n=1 Tax=Demequina zhanjiangensis TaxID=3051659 RepID=A0ABT8G1G5_9MICO|nr:GGDEF domain-containing protein [Demequina sp. SYSU T00b26]MDN4472978.1 GGDEF domain-containing protein [Demequina sp. SYSU T00b26]